jgi:PKD repeat protein
MYKTLLKASTLLFGLAFILSSCKKAPEADFTYEVDGLTVNFTSTSTGEIDGYLWEFGDGSSSTEENPSHTYSITDDYTVKLTVENSKGSNSKTQTVTIEGGSGADLANFPDLDGADGMCVATNTSTWQDGGFFPIEIKVGSAIAFFIDGGANVDVGTVTVDGNNASDVGNNTYLYQDLTGQALTAPVSWEITGGNGFDAFTQDATANFPFVAQITSSDVNTTLDYTLELDGFLTGADSAFVLIVGANNSYKATVGVGVGEYVIPGSELADLGATDFGTVLVSAYNYTSSDIGGKTIYFVNQSSVSKMVKIE